MEHLGLRYSLVLCCSILVTHLTLRGEDIQCNETS